MYVLLKTTSFKKEIKSFQYNQKFLEKLRVVLDILVLWKTLPERYKDHSLLWKYKHYRELHIMPDILLIYEKDPTARTITLAHIGSHSDLFG